MFVSVASQGLSLEERTTIEGETPLTLAIKAGLEPNVTSLLEHGALPDTANSKDETPLVLGNTAGPSHTGEDDSLVRIGLHNKSLTLIGSCIPG